MNIKRKKRKTTKSKRKRKGYNKNGKRGFLYHNPGRPKGSKGQFTTLKQAFINAFKTIGGEAALVQWIEEDLVLTDRKKEFFKILGSMLPREISVSPVPTPDNVEELLKTMSKEQLEKIITNLAKPD